MNFMKRTKIEVKNFGDGWEVVLKYQILPLSYFDTTKVDFRLSLYLKIVYGFMKIGSRDTGKYDLECNAIYPLLTSLL